MKFKFDKIFLPTLCAVGILSIDRLSKLWALHHALNTHELFGPLSFELAFNRGISWGMLHSENPLVRLLLMGAIGVIVALFARYTYDSYTRGKSILPHSMIIAGALSNLWDRVWYPGVIDFIVLSAYGFQFPTFNCADASIVVGVAILFLSESEFFSHE